MHPERYISNRAFWFPEVSQPGQPMETSENPGTWEHGNPCPISGKPHKFILMETVETYGNLRNLLKKKYPSPMYVKRKKTVTI